MSKKAYLTTIADNIRKLPKDEQNEIMMEYEEHFENAKLRGRSEHEIAQKLGNPKLIAQEIILQYKITKAENQPSFNNLYKAVLATLGLGIVNLLCVLVPFIAGIVVIAALFIGSVYLLLSPLLLLIQDGFTADFVIKLPTAVGLVGFGLIILLGGIKLTTLGYRGMIAYLNINREWIRGKSK